MRKRTRIITNCKRLAQYASVHVTTLINLLKAQIKASHSALANFTTNYSKSLNLLRAFIACFSYYQLAFSAQRRSTCI